MAQSWSNATGGSKIAVENSGEGWVKIPHCPTVRAAGCLSEDSPPSRKEKSRKSKQEDVSAMII